ncbi:hypothetical protein E4G67_00265 [Candidatus Bathyarchaeota archaeon]|nr:MAG: hypothetical protein E4G67_00265 [Candidatus Bathyarchaeota archaeon]
MALAPSRQDHHQLVRYALNQVAERGVICTMLPGTTAAGEVTVSVAPTGVGLRAVGMLLDDVEDLNYDRHGEYRQRNVVDVGSVVGLSNEGDFETDQLTGPTPVQGQAAFLGANGSLTTVQASDGLGNVAPALGYFLGAPNANGFAPVHIDL